ncbi:hypothetical protein FOZ63_016174, partial [Perkinsus olseni]
MNASKFMGFRNLILGMLGSKIVVNSTFPLKGGIGMVLSDDTQAKACVEALNRAKGYSAKVRSGLWPRIILFNPAVNRGVTIDHLDRMIRESNVDLVKDIGVISTSSSSTVNPPATGLVGTIYWRGQHLVLRHRTHRSRLPSQAGPVQAITGPVQKCANCLDHNAALTGTGGRRKVDHECTDSACESLAAFVKRQW